MKLFKPGQAVVMRHVREMYRWAAPMRVVEDSGDFVALYTRPGDEYVRMAYENGGPTRDFVAARNLTTSIWNTHHALHLISEGDEHATVLMWAEDDWAFRCWYINFQEPFRRYDRGFESMDLTLDMLIAPDRSAWQWKDEDEFVDIGIAGGWYTHEQLAHLKEYGLQVADRALAGDGVFGEPWPDWRPDPGWQPLQLPGDWDR